MNVLDKINGFLDVTDITVGDITFVTLEKT